MNHYKIFRRGFLKFIVITTVCVLLASCGVNPTPAPVAVIPSYGRALLSRTAKYHPTAVPPQQFRLRQCQLRQVQPQMLKRERSLSPGDRFFPEGVAAAADGTFFAGSLEEGSIARAKPGATVMEPFIKAGANGLVSVLGLYVDDARQTLWACSGDAGNGKLKGTAPVAIKAFDLKTGEGQGAAMTCPAAVSNDLTLDAQGNVCHRLVVAAHFAVGGGRHEAGGVGQGSQVGHGSMEPERHRFRCYQQSDLYGEPEGRPAVPDCDQGGWQRGCGDADQDVARTAQPGWPEGHRLRHLATGEGGAGRHGRHHGARRYGDRAAGAGRSDGVATFAFYKGERLVGGEPRGSFLGSNHCRAGCQSAL